jgi:hypothetical protein
VADVDLVTCTLDMDDLRSKIQREDEVVAVGCLNATGTINDGRPSLGA